MLLGADMFITFTAFDSMFPLVAFFFVSSDFSFLPSILFCMVLKLLSSPALGSYLSDVTDLFIFNFLIVF